MAALSDQTVVTVTRNHSKATYFVKLGGVTETDGVVSLSAGSNVITVEVTAEDDSTTQTYTVTVTRAAPPSTDATLSALTLSGIDFGTFDSTTMSYTARVANSVSQTTVTPTVNHSGASYVIKLEWCNRRGRNSLTERRAATASPYRSQLRMGKRNGPIPSPSPVRLPQTPRSSIWI